jgi:hypothetical protein
MPWIPIFPIKDGKKICVDCKKEFSIEMFPKQSQNKEGIRPDCKECYNKKNKIYYYNNREKVLERARVYGKTEHRKKYCRDRAKIKLKKKREDQATRSRSMICECCFGNAMDTKGIVWDHCHITGKFRGWLCNRCNRVLGMCKDNKEVFEKMIKYLETYAPS